MPRTIVESTAYPVPASQNSPGTPLVSLQYPSQVFYLIDQIDSLKLQAFNLLQVLDSSDLIPVHQRKIWESDYQDICKTLQNLEHEVELLSL